MGTERPGTIPGEDRLALSPDVELMWDPIWEDPGSKEERPAGRCTVTGRVRENGGNCGRVLFEGSGIGGTSTGLFFDRFGFAIGRKLRGSQVKGSFASPWVWMTDGSVKSAVTWEVAMDPELVITSGSSVSESLSVLARTCRALITSGLVRIPFSVVRNGRFILSKRTRKQV